MWTAVQLQLLVDLDAAALACGVDLCLIGAGAIRVAVLLEQPRAQVRATRDLDFVVNVASHATFNRLRRTLVDGHTAKFAATSVEHKFLHNGGGGEIDLVPFGALEVPPGSLTWPVSGRVMSTTGLAATVAGSRPLPAVAASGLRVASLPVLVALKLLAYEDRGTTRSDMRDAGALLEHAHDMFDLGGIDDELAEMLVSDVLTDTNIAAYDIGRMLRVLLDEPARQRALAILGRAVDTDSAIVTDMLQHHRNEERHREVAFARLAALRRALSSTT